MKKKVKSKVKDIWLELLDCSPSWRVANDNIKNRDTQYLTCENLEQGLSSIFGEDDKSRYEIVELEDDTLIIIKQNVIDSLIDAVYRVVKDDEWIDEEEDQTQS